MPLARPSSPCAGALYFDRDAATLQRFDASAGVWREVPAPTSAALCRALCGSPTHRIIRARTLGELERGFEPEAPVVASVR